MGEFQACTAARVLDPQPNNKPVLSLSHGAFPHSSSRVSKAGGGGGGKIGEERGSCSLNNGRAAGGGGRGRAGRSGGALRAPPSKRARLENGELSIPTMEMSAAAVPNKESGAPSFLHHHHVHHHVHHHAAEATNKIAPPLSPPQQQQLQLTIAPEPQQQQNGHAIMPVPFDPHFGADDQHLILDASQNHHLHRHPAGAGLIYPTMPPQVPFSGMDMTEVLAALEIERKKNAELRGLLDRFLENKHNRNKKSKKRQKVEKASLTVREDENGQNASNHRNQLNAVKKEEVSVSHATLPVEGLQVTPQHHPAVAAPPTDRQDTGVTWMCREEFTPADLDKLSKDTISERDDSGDSDDSDDDSDDDDSEDGREKKIRKSQGEEAWKGQGIGEETGTVNLDFKNEAEKQALLGPSMERGQEEGESEGEGKKKRRRKKRKEGKKSKRGDNLYFLNQGFGHQVPTFRGSGVMSSYKKTPKIAFCPKEIKRIMESGILALKNAQSHTIRKIIVFASLGIRHGCEDMYDLDFSHFSVVGRGDAFKSPTDPGEHVLYANVLRRRRFYPNRQNPILCPVRILDEEKAMRPTDPSCPSCLFLCIKYGGPTRNLPQNEYVRQRMGRNKLKSFGPQMCQIALLVHIRTGSFFFKALGITLLFMAGYSEDQVRRETKYRTLDLLRKYYRSDEESKDDRLFHPCSGFFPQAATFQPAVTQKTTIAAKVAGKKAPPPLLSKPPSSSSAIRYVQQLAVRPPTTPPFHLMPPGFSPPLSSIPPGLPNLATASGNLPGPPPGPPPYGIYPAYPPVQLPPPGPGGFPTMPWGPTSSYPPPGSFPPIGPFGYQAFQSTQFLPQACYGLPYRFSPYVQQTRTKESKKLVGESEESGHSDSDSGSSGAGKNGEEICETTASKDTE